jgi:feruloyl esterase
VSARAGGHLLRGVLVCVGFALITSESSAAPAKADTGDTCLALAGATLAGSRVLSAELIAAGKFAPPAEATLSPEVLQRATTLPAFCRVVVRATPNLHSTIGIEVWLPLQSWNDRLLGTGNGGGAGSIAYAMGMIEGLKRGFAVANTDMGVAPDINDIADNPERWVDFGHRATHEMTRVAKSLVRTFYRVTSFRSYFEGCSTGGQQALVTAQRYPEDYDGILAGDPGNNRTHSAGYFLWNYQAVNATPDSKLSTTQWSMVNRAVIAECAGRDGGAPDDQFLTDPRRCSFDPASLPRCKAGSDQSQCLTQRQVAAVRRLYAGPVNPTTGQRIYPGLTLAQSV